MIFDQASSAGSNSPSESFIASANSLFSSSRSSSLYVAAALALRLEPAPPKSTVAAVNKHRDEVLTIASLLLANAAHGHALPCLGTLPIQRGALPALVLIF
mmetsp:Transcript_40634/g.86525  ORF Transcript_40634/g.86525 Transcript_40634/m.86525 type:complete len:101 (+) Transcript_40634:628-930(+)